MSYDLNKKAKFEQMKGEYLSNIVSIEYEMTDFIKCLLEYKKYPIEFQKWFSKTKIRFDVKVDLLIAIMKEDSELKYFRKLARLLHAHKDFRNILAHSFSHFNEIRNSDGEVIPEELVSYEVLRKKLNQLQYIQGMLEETRSPSPNIGPISADDYADWPL